MNIRYIVELNEEERTRLAAMFHEGAKRGRGDDGSPGEALLDALHPVDVELAEERVADRNRRCRRVRLRLASLHLLRNGHGQRVAGHPAA